MAIAQHEAHLTSEHVALLRRMQIIWIPVEAGAPYPSHDYTYGSADVIGDAQRILTKVRGELKDITESEAEAYHEEALALLPNFIAQGNLTPGTYTYEIILPQEEWELTPWACKHRAGPDSNQVQVDVAPEQISLLKHLRFDSRSQIPVNVKRPYGDMTSFELDMADLLGVKADAQPGAQGQSLSNVQIAYLERLHESLEGVMQVWMQNATVHLDEADSNSRYRPKPDPRRFLTAVARKDVPAAEAMLRDGVDALGRDAQKRSAAELAIDNTDHPMLALLLREKTIINAPQGKYERTPLMMAAAKGDSDAVRLAIKFGGDLSIADKYGRTALAFAFINGRNEVIELILSTGHTEAASIGVVSYEPAELKVMNPPVPHPAGVPVKNVIAGSAAARADLKPNDVLLAINDVPLPDFPSLRALLASKKAGDRVKLLVRRQTETLDVEVRLGPPMGGGLKYQ